MNDITLLCDHLEKLLHGCAFETRAEAYDAILRSENWSTGTRMPFESGSSTVVGGVALGSGSSTRVA